MKTIFNSAISSMEEVSTGNPANPLLTVIKFIFSDNQGNANKQGIDEEEFDQIIQSAINMPVKMQLVEDQVGGHELSVPIGHITGMDKIDEGDIKKLVASAVLYKQEFPEEVKFLKDKFDGGEAPGISWELAYKDSAIKDGITWLKQVITAAATFVKHPAYGSRTALLAIASSAAASSNEEVMKKLDEIVGLWKAEAENLDKGGMNVDELETAKKELAEALAKIATLEADLSTAKSENETLTTENGTLKKAELARVRTDKFVSAGFSMDAEEDKKAKRIERWLSMSDEAFDDYLAELVDVKTAAKPATASDKGTGLPKLGGDGTGTLIAIADLKNGLRNASRGTVE